MKATLLHTCVSPGGGQALSITSVPGHAYAFDTQYSDRQEGKKYGGYGDGVIPPNGTQVTPWVVAPSTPLGPAVVYIEVVSKTGAYAHTTLNFQVAASC